MIRYITCLLCCLLLSGCAAMVEDSCNTNAAYAEGVNDASSGRAMNYNYAVICPLQSQAAINASYKQGYNFGLANQPAYVPVPTPVPVPVPVPPYYPYHHHHHYYPPKPPGPMPPPPHPPGPPPGPGPGPHPHHGPDW